MSYACLKCGAAILGGGPHGRFQPCPCGAGLTYTPPNKDEVCAYCTQDLREPGAAVVMQPAGNYRGLREPTCRSCFARWLRVWSIVQHRGVISAPRPGKGFVRWLREHTNHAQLLAELGVDNPWQRTGPDQVACEASAMSFASLDDRDLAVRLGIEENRVTAALPAEAGDLPPCQHDWTEDWPQSCVYCDAVRGLHGRALTVGVA